MPIPARAAFQRLLDHALHEPCPADVAEAIVVTRDHALRLEQALDLLLFSAQNTQRDAPSFSVLMSAHSKKE